MTPIPPNADELVSAYLDGEAAPDEIALIEGSDELLARVETLRKMTSQFGALTSPAPEVKEAHLAAALGAFDDMLASADAAGTAGLTVVPDPPEPDTATEVPAESDQVIRSLDAARERRTGRLGRGWLAAAAAVVLLFVGITALSVRSGGDSLDVADTAAIDAADSSADDSAASEQFLPSVGGDDASADRAQAPAAPAADEGSDDAAAESLMVEGSNDAPVEEAMDAEEEAEEAMAEEEADEAMDDSDDAVGETESGSEVAAEPVPEDLPGFFLGDFATIDALEDRIRADFTTAELSTRAEELREGLFSSCQEQIPVLGADGPPTLVGEASIDAEPVEIHLLAPDQVIVVDQTACEISRQFAVSAS